MYFSTATILAATAALVGRTAAVDHQIVVGGASGLVYTPNSINASIGDTVTFIFQTKNHTVTQSAFATPCNLLVNTTTNAVGFDSGFVPVTANSTEFPAWTLEVTATSPIWFYCAQTGHCEQGMVGAINAPGTGPKTFAAFQALAMGANGTTGGTTPNASGVGAAGGASTSIPSGSVTPDAAATTTSAGASTTSTGSSGAMTTRLGGVGAALGAVAALAMFMA